MTLKQGTKYGFQFSNIHFQMKSFYMLIQNDFRFIPYFAASKKAFAV